MHARLAERLDELGAKVIAFDMFFPERESVRADAQFARAIGASRKVLLGTLFLVGREEVRHLGARQLEQGKRAIELLALDKVRTSGDAGTAVAVQEPFGVIVSIDELQERAAFAGHLNVVPDTDGMVRRAPLVVRYGGRYFPSFDVQAARAYLGTDDLAVDVAQYGIEGISIGARQVPLDEEGRLLVRYRGREGSFDTVSIADILEGKRRPRAAARPRGADRQHRQGHRRHARNALRQRCTPGVEVRANIIENLLDGEFLQRPDWMSLVDIGALALIGLAARLAAAAPGRHRRRPCSRSGAAAGYVLLADYLFVTEGLWLNVVYPDAARRAAVRSAPRWCSISSRSPRSATSSSPSSTTCRRPWSRISSPTPPSCGWAARSAS